VNPTIVLSKIQEGGYVIMLRWWQVLLLLIACIAYPVWVTDEGFPPETFLAIAKSRLHSSFELVDMKLIKSSRNLSVNACAC